MENEIPTRMTEDAKAQRLEEAVESSYQKGGVRVSQSSLSAKLNDLIKNDQLSNSSKNKKAKELGIPIINEKIFKNLYNSTTRG